MSVKFSEITSIHETVMNLRANKPKNTNHYRAYRRNIWEIIGDFFRFGPGPFDGNEIAMTIDKVKKVSKGIKKLNKLEGSAKNNELRKIISNVRGGLSEELVAAKNHADEILDSHDKLLEKHTLPSLHKAHDATATITFEASKNYDSIIADVESDLAPIGDAAYSSKKNLEAFEQRHDLYRHDSATDVSPITIFLAILALCGEFVINLLFFKGISEDGITSAIRIVFIFTIGTLAIGFLLSWLLRYWRKDAPGEGKLARILITPILLFISFYLLLAAHVRHAIDSKSLAPFIDAQQTIKVAPFDALLDLPALLYDVAQLAIFAVLALEIIRYLGKFPGHKAIAKFFLEKDALYNGTKNGMKSAFEDTYSSGESAFDNLESDVHVIGGLISECNTEYENTVEGFSDKYDEIQSAAHMLDAAIPPLDGHSVLSFDPKNQRDIFDKRWDGDDETSFKSRCLDQIGIINSLIKLIREAKYNLRVTHNTKQQELFKNIQDLEQKLSEKYSHDTYTPNIKTADKNLLK